MSKLIYLFFFSSSLVGVFNMAEAVRIDVLDDVSGSAAICSQEEGLEQSDGFQSRCRKCRKPKAV